MNRRDFFIRSVGLLGLPLILQEVGCDQKSDLYSSDNGTDDVGFTVRSSVDDGHSHTVQISYTNVNDPPVSDRTITSSSEGSHTHQITLTPTDYETLKNGQTITRVSTTVGNHSHTFNIKVPE